MRQNRIYIFIITIIVLVVINQTILTYAINQQQYDATVVNYAGKQRMLSQSIAKTVLLINRNFKQNIPSNVERDNLKKLVEKWSYYHEVLKNGDKGLKISTKKSAKIQQLFLDIEPLYEIILENAQRLTTEKDSVNIHLQSKTILNNEQAFLKQMDAIALQYNTESIQKSKQLKAISYTLALLLILVISIQLLAVIKPLFAKLLYQNEKLSEANEKLKHQNRELDVIKHNIEAKNRQIQRQNEIFAENNSMLLETKNEAVELSRAKSDFLSNMSHEIRTPLNAIIGVSNLLSDDQPTPSQAEQIDTLLFSAENLMVIINDILDYSKIGAGKVKLEAIEFNIRRIMNGIYKTLHGNAQKKGLELQTIIGKNVPETLIGDPTRLSQILINLVNNAIKFTPRGNVTFQVILKEKNTEKATLAFSVTDTGIGIAADKQKDIFDSFSQANTSTTRLYGGTGLGLAITKQLLELQGSQIQLISELNKGTTFFFDLTLPIGKQNKKEEMQAIQLQRPKKQYKEGFTSNSKILLVDDNAINLVIAKRFLNKWNLEVDIAKNGKEALEKVKNDSYGLIFMDINMPEMDGYEATRIIRSWREAEYQNLPIVALTASVFDALKYQAVEAGMNDYLSKPFKPQELYDMVDRHLLTV